MGQTPAPRMSAILCYDALRHPGVWYTSGKASRTLQYYTEGEDKWSQTTGQGGGQMLDFLHALGFGCGWLLVGVGLTILALCCISYRDLEGHDSVESLLTLVGSGAPGTLGLVLIIWGMT
jgi:hypothetical protein